MNTMQRGMPSAPDHPLWEVWSRRGFDEDLKHYGVIRYLHHYVRSPEILHSILSSGCLWASDAKQLEDTTELEHGIPICEKALDMIREPILQEHVALVKRGLNRPGFPGDSQM